MTTNVTNLLLVLAAICFLLGAAGVVSRLNLVALGLFFWLVAQTWR